MCDQCDKLPAAHFCRTATSTCALVCNERHGEHRKKKSHTVRALADMRAADLPASPEAKCADHPTVSMDVWCDTHKQLLCSKCLIGPTYRACEYDAVSTMAEKHQPEADAAMARAKDRITVLVAVKEAVTEGKANWMSQPSSSLFSPAS